MATKTTKLGVGVALLAAVLGIAVFAGVRFLFFGLEEATPWDKPARIVQGQVELTYDGRDCRDRVEVEVDESDASVVITITETVRVLACRDDAAPYETTVELSSPLGDRDLVDGACLLGQFSQDPRCDSDLTRFTR
ncbi:MAG: hypothetical protein WB471_03155 [Nocardioides sp.]